MSGEPAAQGPRNVKPLYAPSDQEFLEEFGVEPEIIDELGGARRLCFENEHGERLVLVIDLAERMIAYQWWAGSAMIADVVRDAVTDVRIVGRARTGVEAAFEVPGYHGTLAIEIHPRVVVRDVALRGGAT